MKFCKDHHNISGTLRKLWKKYGPSFLCCLVTGDNNIQELIRALKVVNTSKTVSYWGNIQMDPVCR